MAMIFPSMDPYLEEPQIWQGFHQHLVVYIADHLQPKLRPRYIASLQERVFVEGPDREIIPDIWLRQTQPFWGERPVALANGDGPVVVNVPGLEIHETYIAIIDRHSGQKIVTVIEVVSPTNKYPGEGRKSYLTKQQEVRKSEAHLVEIDLLRTGHHVLAVAEWAARGQGAYDYLVCVNRAQGLREEFDLYPRRLRERLPKIRVPLAEGDPDVILELQMVVENVFEAGCYGDRLNYDAPCRPPLSSEDQEWANERIQAARQRA
jgi:hypothetical protein